MLNLDFNHHIILVNCKESSLIQKLQDEFHFFEATEPKDPWYVIDLYLEAPPELPPMVAVKLLETSVIYRLGPRKYIDYFGEALTVKDSQEKVIKIFAKDEARLYELAFLAIHSLMGEKLDQDGMPRIHAMAVSLHRTNAVVMLPSKGGKSTLITHLLDNPDIKIISDDITLTDIQGRIYPFPTKISLNDIPTSGPLKDLTWNKFERLYYPPKWTGSLAQLKTRVDEDPSENTLLIAGFRLSSGQSIISEVSKWKMAMPILEHMIIGMGLPQIIELFLDFRFTDVFKLAYHALKRLACAIVLIKKCRTFHFYLGPDKAYNSQLLIDLLNEHGKS